MKISADGQFKFFASDLMKFQSCEHATALDIRRLEHGDIEPAGDDEEVELVQNFGHAHEEAFTEKLKSAGFGVIELPRKFGNPEQEATETVAAMRAGHEVIAQASLGAGGRWGGYADFLFKVDRPSRFGDFSYEVADTKLSRSPKPAQILQLCLYSDLLAEIQQCRPEYAHLELGSGDRFSIRLNDFRSYSAYARERFEDFVVERPKTRAEPVQACRFCRWRVHCSDQWQAEDSLVLLPGILKSQRMKLEAAGITSIPELAELRDPIPGLAPRTQEKLVSHARLQNARRAGGEPSFELLPLEAGRGLARLPKPDRGDVFYDIEGDPYYEGGLEYLHGVWFERDGRWVFRDFWAHDRATEGASVDELMRFFAQRLRDYPNAHIYHYAPYEITALRRLTKQHRCHEALLDQFQRDSIFVDLYSVVTGAIRVSEGGYSIKDLEAYYMEKRSGDVASAGASVVAYEKWRDTQDPGILEEIRAYNELDCISTQKLRDWLIAQVRPIDIAWPVLGDEAEDAGIDFERVAAEEEEERLISERFEPLKDLLGEKTGQLVIDLNSFHRRERKPAYWAIFDRLSQDTDELVEDLECLAGLTAIGESEKTGRGPTRRRYSFPQQDTKLVENKAATLKPADGLVAVTPVEIDLEARQACVQFPGKAGDPPDFIDLLPPGPVNDRVLIEGIRATSDYLLVQDDTVNAFRQFLLRGCPTFTDGRDEILSNQGELPEQIYSAISCLDRSTLAIQGPPGTGKTYVSALSIARLVQQGKRIAVSSNSHKAIENLLVAIAKRLDDENIAASIVQKVSRESSKPIHERIQQVTRNNDDAVEGADVVGGTAWHFAGYGINAFDHLFVDEAGQVSTANLMAMAACAKNIVLVGDPMQLPQPVQGSHPGTSGMSSLEYLLGDYRTVPPDRGVFLPTSRRMQDGVCGFISSAVYEGRLGNDAGASGQQLFDSSSTLRLGSFLVPVAHEGNAQVCLEEAKAIQLEINRLVGGLFIDRDGNRHKLSHSDLMVVAPYNAQVNLLRSRLPSDVRVGTVDKFQGQEAPVCMLSMTTSSAAELPRNLEFLFSLNRINVAVSRAKALALVFASPRLLEVPCNSVDQIKLVNTICFLNYYEN